MVHPSVTPQPLSPATLGIAVIPTGAGVGAEIRGLYLRTLTQPNFAQLHLAWIDHQVLLFRGQHLSDGDLVAFSRRLGELDVAPNQETGQRFVEGYPEIYVVSNVVENGPWQDGLIILGSYRWLLYHWL